MFPPLVHIYATPCHPAVLPYPRTRDLCPLLGLGWEFGCCLPLPPPFVVGSCPPHLPHPTLPCPCLPFAGPHTTCLTPFPHVLPSCPALLPHCSHCSPCCLPTVPLPLPLPSLPLQWEGQDQGEVPACPACPTDPLWPSTRRNLFPTPHLVTPPHSLLPDRTFIYMYLLLGLVGCLAYPRTCLPCPFGVTTDWALPLPAAHSPSCLCLPAV